MVRFVIQQELALLIPRYVMFYEQNGAALFQADAPLSLFVPKIKLFDANKTVVLLDIEGVISFRPTFNFIQNGQFIAKMTLQYFPAFSLNFTLWLPNSNNKLVLKSNFLGTEYNFRYNGEKLIARATKDMFQLLDSYRVEVFDEEAQSVGIDPTYILAMMLVVDVYKQQQKRRSNNAH